MKKPVVYSLMMAMLLLIAGPISAGDTAVLDIKPPKLGNGPPAEGPDLKEGKFDGTGMIDRIADQEIVISDTYYRLRATVVYKYLDGRLANADDFPVGTTVWFVLYADNIIESVWREGG